VYSGRYDVQECQIGESAYGGTPHGTGQVIPSQRPSHSLWLTNLSIAPKYHAILSDVQLSEKAVLTRYTKPRIGARITRSPVGGIEPRGPVGRVENGHQSIHYSHTHTTKSRIRIFVGWRATNKLL